ncbi:MAG: hypothetical protein IT561_16785 [Alphaproteobacteria bacterium]|nr:hypothetical protein [Alphaproteobacteria bacterium]
MATILVAANAHLDRVWRLAAPLRAGGRNAWTSVETRYGGGGFNTGSVLLALGHAVRLATTLADDDAGRRHRDALAARGFAVDAVAMVPGATQPLEILLDPSGERTILSPAEQRPGPAHLALDGVDLAYVNLRRWPGDPAALRRHAERIVAQLPLVADEPRPARVLIAARSDVGGDDDGILARARRAAGASLEAVVVTAGAGAVTVLPAGISPTLPVETLPHGTDTTGAGDVFAAGLLDGLAAGAAIGDTVARAVAIAGRVLTDRGRYIDDRIALP